MIFFKIYKLIFFFFNKIIRLFQKTKIFLFSVQSLLQIVFAKIINLHVDFYIFFKIWVFFGWFYITAETRWFTKLLGFRNYYPYFFKFYIVFDFLNFYVFTSYLKDDYKVFCIFKWNDRAVYFATKILTDLFSRFYEFTKYFHYFSEVFLKSKFFTTEIKTTENYKC